MLRGSCSDWSGRFHILQNCGSGWFSVFSSFQNYGSGWFSVFTSFKIVDPDDFLFSDPFKIMDPDDFLFSDPSKIMNSGPEIVFGNSRESKNRQFDWNIQLNFFRILQFIIFFSHPDFTSRIHQNKKDIFRSTVYI